MGKFEIQIAGERIYVPARTAYHIEHEREGAQEEIEFQIKWANENVLKMKQRFHLHAIITIHAAGFFMMSAAQKKIYCRICLLSMPAVYMLACEPPPPEHVWVPGDNFAARLSVSIEDSSTEKWRTGE